MSRIAFLRDSNYSDDNIIGTYIFDGCLAPLVMCTLCEIPKLLFIENHRQKLKHASYILAACNDTYELPLSLLEQLQLLLILDDLFRNFLRIPVDKEIFVAQIYRERDGFKDVYSMIPRTGPQIECKYTSLMFLTHIVHLLC